MTKNNSTLLLSLSTAPLRLARSSLYTCRLCRLPITRGQHYLDRGHQRRSHPACVTIALRSKSLTNPSPT